MFTKLQPVLITQICYEIFFLAGKTSSRFFHSSANNNNEIYYGTTAEQ